MQILPKIFTHTLQNGLEVVAIPLHNNSQVISTNIFYKVGSKDEILGKTGIAHMLEHLSFKSTKNLQEGEFDEIVKGFGGINNASTGFDYTHYFIKSIPENLDKSLELFAELMQNLNLLEKEFKPERDVVLEERLWRTDNSPLGCLQFALFNTAFSYHPYHWTPIGFKDDIKNWKIEDIREFYKTFYQPQNAILLVCGDINEEEVFKLSKKHFEAIQNRCKVPTRHEVEPIQQGAKKAIVYNHSDVQMLALGYKIPNFSHEDQVALSALSSLLSDGKSSILYKRLITKKRLLTQIYAYNLENFHDGLFIFLGVCNADIKAKQVKKEIDFVMNDIKNGKFYDTDLEKIKLIAKSDFIYSMQSSSSVASTFGSYLAKGDIKPLSLFLQKLETINKKDIMQVARKYFTSKNSTTIILKKDNSDEK